MGYTMYDSSGGKITQADLQNKQLWCRHGETKELSFVAKHGRDLNLIINPEKETNPFALDLRNTKHDIPADLKTQNTPFFTAERYDLDPQYAVTFNHKDVIRYHEYMKSYSQIFVYFWVNWVAVKMSMGSKTYSVEPMYGVWGIRFSNLVNMLSDKRLHSYTQRVNDKKGNAKDSYVLDLRDSKFGRLA